MRTSGNITTILNLKFQFSMALEVELLSISTYIPEETFDCVVVADCTVHALNIGVPTTGCGGSNVYLVYIGVMHRFKVCLDPSQVPPYLFC